MLNGNEMPQKSDQNVDDTFPVLPFIGYLWTILVLLEWKTSNYTNKRACIIVRGLYKPDNTACYSTSSGALYGDEKRDKKDRLVVTHSDLSKYFLNMLQYRFEDLLLLSKNVIMYG